MKRYPEVWEALLPEMGLTAMLRNLGKMTEVGLLGAFSDAERLVVSRLERADALRAARVHPLQILVALNTYAQGHGEKGKLTWKPRRKVVDALDGAFYLAFQAIEPDARPHPAGARRLGLDGRRPDRRHARHHAAGGKRRHGARHRGRRAQPRARGLHDRPPPVHAPGHRQRHLAARRSRRAAASTTWSRRISDLPFGGTDCALPMIWAAENKVPVDVFCVYTDSETWAGDIHPVQALRAYRQKMGIGAKLVVIGMVSNGFTIADPDDGGMLDVVGFDTDHAVGHRRLRNPELERRGVKAPHLIALPRPGLPPRARYSLVHYASSPWSPRCRPPTNGSPGCSNPRPFLDHMPPSRRPSSAPVTGSSSGTTNGGPANAGR